VEHHEDPVGRQRLPEGVEILVFDVGETLVDETRMWTDHAREIGATPFTLMAALGSLIERGRDHREVWSVLGTGRPVRPFVPRLSDLYPDALDCLRAARIAGMRIGIAANQPAGVVDRLADLGIETDLTVSSHDLGVAKPDPEFFAALTRRAGAEAGRILYVGDRLDNDILPARAAGMRTAFLRRGPWALIQSRSDAPGADLVLDSLDQLTRILTA